MDTSDIEIQFDKNGNCNHCNNYFNNIAGMAYQGKESDEAFEQLIVEMKKKGKKSKYDCVIGISGGIDSSYVAYLAKQKELRVLLVHLDNGWNSEISEQNVKNIAELLNFDYKVFKLDWEEFRQIQIAFLKASIPEAETPTDMAIPAALHYFASKYNVKYIVSGGNFATESILPNTWFYNPKDTKYFYSVLKQNSHLKINKFPIFGWQQETYYKIAKGIKTVYFLNYVPFSKNEAMKILEKELNWKYYGGKHYESKYTGFAQAYILPKKFNIDYRRATFSTQICAGTMDRQEALKLLEEKGYNQEKIGDEIQYICSKLEISVKEFNEVMEQPPKNYKDYPNDESKLKKIYTIYRKLTGKKDYRGE